MSFSPTAWLLKWKGLTQTFGAWNIIDPAFTFRSMDDDEFVFTVRQDIAQAPVFSFGDSVTAYKVVNGVSTPWFVGTITKRTLVAQPGDERIRYVASGPWYQLKRSMFQVKSSFYNGACGKLLQSTSKVVLYQDPTFGTSITTGQQIINAILYAQTLGISIGVGITPAFVTVPFEESRDLTIADVIRRSLQWTPDAVTWFDYSSGTGILNCQQRAGLSAVTLPSGAGTDFVSAELIPRDDLVPEGVVFNYVGGALCNVIVPPGCVDPSTGQVNNLLIPVVSQHPVPVSTVTQDVAGAFTIFGVLVATIDLNQLTQTTWEAPPLGLAGQFFLSLITVFWDGEILLRDNEVPGNVRPGKVVNITGAAPAWATMNSQVQQVHEDLQSGTTSITVGTPQHLSPQIFVNLIQMFRRRPSVNQGFAATATPQSSVSGGSGTDGSNCNAGQHPPAKKQQNQTTSADAAAIQSYLDICSLNVCNGGQSTQLKVYCPPQ